MLAATAVLLLASCAANRPDGLAEVLLADAVHPSYAIAEDQFGRLVGRWSLVVEYRNEDGSWISRQGEWRFGWILGGRAIADVWTVWDDDQRTNIRGYGATVRVFNSATGDWRVSWFGVLTNNYTTFTARALDGEIVMTAQEQEEQVQWIFYDVKDNSFRWRAQSSTDGGMSWAVQQRMYARRVMPR